MALTKQVKDLYNKNFKTLKKQIQEHTRIWKDIPCSRIGKINILKNGQEIDSEELRRDLHIWIVEQEINILYKNKDVKGYYVKGKNRDEILLCVNTIAKNTYNIIKLLILKIIEGKSNFFLIA